MKRNYLHPMPCGETVKGTKEFVEELWALETLVMTNKKLTDRSKAKCLVALCYDYMTINMDEVVDRLYPRIKNICPDYFSTYMVEDMGQSADFKFICESLAVYFEKRNREENGYE